MKFEAFEQRARADWERIPATYKDGIDGLTVDRGAKAHPSLDDVYTLGECVTEAWPSEYGGPETIRSIVVLYYGSFFRLSRLDPDFDWEHELWETLTHELQHHLESLAADSGLIDLDYAMDENFKRVNGKPFDASFYRAGESLGGGWYRVEEEYYCEITIDGPGELAFDWNGAEYRVSHDPAPDDPPVLFLRVVEGLAAPPRELYLVVRRREGWRATLRRLLRRGGGAGGTGAGAVSRGPDPAAAGAAGGRQPGRAGVGDEIEVSVERST
jgi:hypothetical protein